MTRVNEAREMTRLIKGAMLMMHLNNDVSHVMTRVNV
jgi:hypothetical protein